MTKKLSLQSQRLRQVLSLCLAVVLIGAISYLGVRYYDSSKAATAGPSITLEPATGTYQAGQNISVSVWEDSQSTPIQGVQAFLKYAPSQLQLKDSANPCSEGGKFTDNLRTDASTSGVIKIARGMVSGSLTGRQPVVTCNFTVLASTGTTTLTIDGLPNSFQSNGGTKITTLWGTAQYTLTKSETVTRDAAMIFDPSTVTVESNKEFSVTVRMRSPTQKAYSGEAWVQFPADQLQLLSINNSGKFPKEIYTNQGAGTADIVRGVDFEQFLLGEDVFTTLNFKAIGSSGAANISLKFTPGATTNSSTAANGAGKNILGSVGNVNVTIQPVNNGGGGGDGGGGGGGNTGGGSGDAGDGEPVYSGGNTYHGNVSLVGNETQVEGSVDLEPTIDPDILANNPGDTITKVEYYLNKKLVATKTTSPFTYTFDTKKLKNGTYEMTVKTYYKSGAVDTNTDKLSVKNPITLAYILAHYTFGIFLTLLVLAAIVFVAIKFLFPKMSGTDGMQSAYDGYDGYDPYTDPNAAAGDYNTGYDTPDPSMVTPSAGQMVTPQAPVEPVAPQPAPVQPTYQQPAPQAPVAPAAPQQTVPAPAAPAAPQTFTPQQPTQPATPQNPQNGPQPPQPPAPGAA